MYDLERKKGTFVWEGIEFEVGKGNRERAAECMKEGQFSRFLNKM